MLSLEMVTFGFLLRQDLVFLSVRDEDVEGTTFGVSPFLTVLPLMQVGWKGLLDFRCVKVSKNGLLYLFLCLKSFDASEIHKKMETTMVNNLSAAFISF